LKKRRHRVWDIASVVGKLISLEPALGRSILVGTRLTTIAIVVATEVTEASLRSGHLWMMIPGPACTTFGQGVERLPHRLLAHRNNFIFDSALGGNGIFG
jgi:hypothetical protein